MPEREQTLGPYSVLHKLGAGGMGEVYLARDPRLEREVALKLLPPQLRDDPERRRRFLREARTAAKLSHPNIRAIHEVGEADGRDYLAFEYVEGKTLDALLRERSLSRAELIDLALPLADALAYAHERGVIHRDLKASNVMVTPRGHPKLLDFGLAKLLGEENALLERARKDLTIEGAILGTPQAMSPEQALGRTVDPRSEVFSFGSLLYEMASGQPAFRGGTVMEVLDAVIHAEPADLAVLRPDLPAELAGIVARAMRKDPTERYPSVAAMAADLERLGRAAESGLAPAPRARRTLVPGMLLAGAGLATVLMWALLRGDGAGDDHAAEVPSDATAQRSIAVIGFELAGARATDSDGPGLDRVLTSLLTTALAEAGDLEVASSSKVVACLRQAGQRTGAPFDPALAAESARAAEVDLMLVGQVLVRGARLVSTAELVDVASGNALASMRREAESEEELFSLAAGLAADVRERLGLARAGGRTFDLEGELTESPEAYFKFVAGEMAVQEGRFPDARRLLRQATEIDPTFAFAHARLGLADEWEGDLAGAVQAYESALAHADRLPERWERLMRIAVLYNTGSYEQAFADLDALIGEGNALPEAYNTLGEFLTHYSRYEDPARARDAFLRVLELDPNFQLVLYHVVHHSIDLGDVRVVAELLERMRGSNGNPEGIARLELGLDLARRDAAAVASRIEAAGRQLEDLREYRWSLVALGRLDDLEATLAAHSPAARSTSLRDELDFQADLAMRRGRLREAVRLGLQASECFGEQDALTWYAPNRTWPLLEAARTKLLLGDPLDEACALVERGMEIDPFALRLLFWKTRWLAGAGRIDEADRERKRMLSLAARSPSPVAQSWLRLASTHLALAKGDVARAQLDLSIPSPPGAASRTHAALVRAWVARAAGDGATEVAAWREALEAARGPQEVEHDLVFHALYGLADAEERAGLSLEARAHGRELLEAWKACEEQGVAMLEDARRRWGG